MATNEALEMLKAQRNAVKAARQLAMGSEELSPNTRRTKTHNLRREIKRLDVIIGLLSIVKEESLTGLMNKDKNFKESFLSILNPGTGGTKITVEAGDSFMDLVFNKYKDAKDVVARINKAAGKAGLVLDSKTNTFVKKA